MPATSARTWEGGSHAVPRRWHHGPQTHTRYDDASANSFKNENCTLYQFFFDETAVCVGQA